MKLNHNLIERFRSINYSKPFNITAFIIVYLTTSFIFFIYTLSNDSVFNYITFILPLFVTYITDNLYKFLSLLFNIDNEIVTTEEIIIKFLNSLAILIFIIAYLNNISDTYLNIYVFALLALIF